MHTTHHTTPQHQLCFFFLFFFLSPVSPSSAKTGSKSKDINYFSILSAHAYHVQDLASVIKNFFCHLQEGEKELRMAPIPHPSSAPKHQYSSGQVNSCP